MDFWKGHKTQIGAVGVFLTTLGGIVSSVVAAPPADLGGWLHVGQQLFLALGGYGAVQKALRWWQAKHEPKAA